MQEIKQINHKTKAYDLREKPTSVEEKTTSQISKNIYYQEKLSTITLKLFMNLRSIVKK